MNLFEIGHVERGARLSRITTVVVQGMKDFYLEDFVVVNGTIIEISSSSIYLDLPFCRGAK